MNHLDQLVYNAVNFMQGVTWQTVALIAVFVMGISIFSVRRAITKVSLRQLELNHRDREIDLQKAQLLKSIEHERTR